MRWQRGSPCPRTSAARTCSPVRTWRWSRWPSGSTRLPARPSRPMRSPASRGPSSTSCAPVTGPAVRCALPPGGATPRPTRSRSRWAAPPSREELAASLGVPRSELDNLQVDVHRAIMISIDAETGADGTSLDLPDTGESPERALLRGERARYLHDAIRALPDRLDEVIERNFFGDESLTDIAEDLGVTLSRVSQMRARALTLLHAAISETWEGTTVSADGGVRARNQQRAYLDRLTGRSSPPAAPEKPAAQRRAPVPATNAPVRIPARSGWQVPGRRETPRETARPA